MRMQKLKRKLEKRYLLKKQKKKQAKKDKVVAAPTQKTWILVLKDLHPIKKQPFVAQKNWSQAQFVDNVTKAVSFATGGKLKKDLVFTYFCAFAQDDVVMTPDNGYSTMFETVPHADPGLHTSQSVDTLDRKDAPYINVLKNLDKSILKASRLDAFVTTSLKELAWPVDTKTCKWTKECTVCFEEVEGNLPVFCQLRRAMKITFGDEAGTDLYMVNPVAAQCPFCQKKPMYKLVSIVLV